MEIFRSYVSMPEGNILFLNCDEFKWFYLFWILLGHLIVDVHPTWKNLSSCAPTCFCPRCSTAHQCCSRVPDSVQWDTININIRPAFDALQRGCWCNMVQSIPWSKWLTPAQNECFWGATQNVHLAWLWSSGEVAWLASTYGAIGGYDESWSTDGAFTSWLSQLIPFL